MNKKASAESSSFRDPGSSVYSINDVVYRQINESYIPQFQHLMTSGLYQRLVAAGYLIQHTEVSLDFAKDNFAKTVIRPEKIDFISYPYEWCFSQLKEAALLTLELNRIALEYGMILKDASAFNIQFKNGKPLLMDTGSFEFYSDGTPWAAYNQFCKHFFAPLVLMSRVDPRLNKLLSIFVDGVPLEMASRLLPLNSYFSFSILAHVHLHAKSLKKFSNQSHVDHRKLKVSKTGLLGLFDNLQSFLIKTELNNASSPWSNYYEQCAYSDKAANSKKEHLAKLIQKVGPNTAWDIGGNTGHYSRLLAAYCPNVVSFDNDPFVVETNYLNSKKGNLLNYMSLVQDVSAPSPALGFNHNERASLADRSNADLVMALALVHHLAISSNIPFFKMAEYFSRLSPTLIIEFADQDDPQVRLLQKHRGQAPVDYNLASFEKEFSIFYDILEVTEISDSLRKIFLMKRRS